MRVAVWKIGKWLPSKFNDGDNCRIACKGLDDKKTYYLNVTEVHNVYGRWKHLLVEGNVLDVKLINEKTIDKFCIPTLVRKVEQGKNVQTILQG